MFGVTDVAPSVYHETVRLADAGDRRLAALLDGRHARADLIAVLGEPFGGPAGAARLETALNSFAQLALLVA